jgi:hypothetical protein
MATKVRNMLAMVIKVLIAKISGTEVLCAPD